MRLLFQLADEVARSRQSFFEIVDSEKQGKAISWPAREGLVNDGCSWTPHACRHSNTYPSVSTIWPK